VQRIGPAERLLEEQRRVLSVHRLRDLRSVKAVLLLALLAVPAWGEDCRPVEKVAGGPYFECDREAVYLLAGIESSWNYGELPPAPLLQLAYENPWLDFQAHASTMRKSESDAGFILGADLDVHRWIGPLVGLGYTYRDGGDWVKHGGWLRAGYAFGALVLVGKADLTTQNRVRSIGLRLRAPLGDWALETRAGVARYQQGNETETGGEVSLSFGRTFGAS
jgi:hypothetical protein